MSRRQNNINIIVIVTGGFLTRYDLPEGTTATHPSGTIVPIWQMRKPSLNRIKWIHKTAQLGVGTVRT